MKGERAQSFRSMSVNSHLNSHLAVKNLKTKM